MNINQFSWAHLLCFLFKVRHCGLKFCPTPSSWDPELHHLIVNEMALTLTAPPCWYEAQQSTSSSPLPLGSGSYHQRSPGNSLILTLKFSFGSLSIPRQSTMWECCSSLCPASSVLLQFCRVLFYGIGLRGPMS